MRTFILLAAALPLAAAVDFDNPGPPCWIQDAVAIGSDVWLACDRGAVIHSSDFGKTWQRHPIPAEYRVRSMAFVDAKRGFVVGDNGALLKTTDGGNQWTPARPPVENDFREIFFLGERGWLAGYGGTMLHTADGGETWTPQDTGTRQSIEAIYFVDANRGWGVGWAGTVLRTVNGGETWEEIRAPAAEWSLSGVYFKDANEGWAVGMLGQILHSTDGGKSWEAIGSGSKSWLRAVYVDASGHGWITAENDILETADGGKTWKQAGKEGWIFLERFVHVNGELWAVGPFGIYRKAAGDNEWRTTERFGKVTS
ncbi:MAG: YCF48-related protein [Bryobacteraceae bacterium]